MFVLQPLASLMVVYIFLCYSLYFKQHPVSKCDDTCRKNMLCEVKSGRSHDPHICDDLLDDLLTKDDRQSFYNSYIRWLNDAKAC